MQLDVRGGDRVDVLDGDMRHIGMRRGRLSGGLLRIRLRTMQAGDVWRQL